MLFLMVETCLMNDGQFSSNSFLVGIFRGEFLFEKILRLQEWATLSEL